MLCYEKVSVETRSVLGHIKQSNKLGGVIMKTENTEKQEVGRIIKRKEVLKITGISSAQMYRNIKAGLFPSPYSLGRRAVGWKESEIAAWLDGLQPANSLRKR